MSKDLTLISIDWDFFIWNGAESKEKITIHPGTDNEIDYPISLFFDWGHSESWQLALGQYLWMSRFSYVHRMGHDLEKICNIRTDDVQPGEFLTEIQKRFAFNEDAPVWVADSHVYATPSISSLGSFPIKVVNFDAHHDLGYDGEKIKNEIEEDQCDCASWLFHGLDSGSVSSADIVYPDWKGKIECRDFEHLAPHRKKIQVFTWSEWLKSASREKAIGSFICRSSAWTPPWLDGHFHDFYQRLGHEAVCWDCISPPEEKVGAYDACEPREWDRPAALEHAIQEEVAFSQAKS